MWQIILVLINPVLDDVTWGNTGFVFLEGTITTEEHNLYHRIYLIAQNVFVILDRNVLLQSYHEVHRKPTNSCLYPHRTPSMFHPWQQTICIIIWLGWCSPENSARSMKQGSSAHTAVFHYSIVQVLWIKHHLFVLLSLSHWWRVFELQLLQKYPVYGTPSLLF